MMPWCLRVCVYDAMMSVCMCVCVCMCLCMYLCMWVYDAMVSVCMCVCMCLCMCVCECMMPWCLSVRVCVDDVVDYDWSSNRYSSWSESRWSNNAFQVRIFLMPSHKQEVGHCHCVTVTVTVTATILAGCNYQSHQYHSLKFYPLTFWTVTM